MMWRKFQSSNFLNLSAFENDSKIASLFFGFKIMLYEFAETRAQQFVLEPIKVQFSVVTKDLMLSVLK